MSELIKSDVEEAVNPHKSKGFRRIINAGFNSIDGICAALKHESAFRQEIILCLLLIPIPFLFNSNIIEKILMISSLLLILIVELLNSAIEWATDYISLHTHPYAKRIKDMGSAAVFISLLNAGIVWILILNSIL